MKIVLEMEQLEHCEDGAVLGGRAGTAALFQC